FFASRRRHTRCSRDWSADVCSSDLPPYPAGINGGNHEASHSRASGPRRPVDLRILRGNPATIIERTLSAQGVCSPMNKNELIDAVSANSGLSKADAGRAVDAVVGSITGALKSGENVSLIGFGTFEVRERAARTGRNPRTGEEIQIAAAKNPAFKAGKALKDAVN